MRFRLAIPIIAAAACAAAPACASAGVRADTPVIALPGQAPPGAAVVAGPAVNAAGSTWAVQCLPLAEKSGYFVTARPDGTASYSFFDLGRPTHTVTVAADGTPLALQEAGGPQVALAAAPPAPAGLPASASSVRIRCGAKKLTVLLTVGQGLRVVCSVVDTGSGGRRPLGSRARAYCRRHPARCQLIA